MPGAELKREEGRREGRAGRPTEGEAAHRGCTGKEERLSGWAGTPCWLPAPGPPQNEGPPCAPHDSTCLGKERNEGSGTPRPVCKAFPPIFPGVSNTLLAGTCLQHGAGWGGRWCPLNGDSWVLQGLMWEGLGAPLGSPCSF